VINMSCFNTKRILFWMVWNQTNNVAEYLVNVWILGMFPAFVDCPVSGSLFGSFSHVKDSVRVSVSLMSSLR